MEALTAEAGELPRLAEVLERKLEVAARGPREQKAILERLAELYDARLGDPARAAQARARLAALDGPPPAPELETPAAEVEAAPQLADPTYWRETSAEAEPAVRANALVAKARVALARGDVGAALTELDAALADAPDHAPSLALAGELAFRRQDWPRARQLYGALERAPAVGDAISHEQLVQRRAALAHRTGDLGQAEALYRELAILSPQSVEARRALSELALARGDTMTAAHRLEELLRMLPAGAVADVADLRHRLGAIYAETGAWPAARAVLELVAEQDPGRIPALELLLQAYQRLEMPAEAADVCGRLARLYGDRGQRAAVLYRQGEIRRTQLSDAAGALDAYLRSSDADPKFVPSRRRLVEHFWSEGDLDVVADLAGDLAGAPLSPEIPADAELIVRLAMAASGPRAATLPRFRCGEHPALAVAAARVLAEAGDRAAARGLDAIESTLDPMLARARFWAGDSEQLLAAALIPMLRDDPARPGPALMLGSLAARIRRPALARAAYSLAAFVDPNGVAAYLLDGLPAAEPAHGPALRVGSAVDHPLARGPARRALARLAPALLGLDADQQAPKPSEGSGLAPARAIELRRIADLLAAPAFVVAPDDQALRTTQPSGDRRRVRLVPTQPAGLLISPNASSLGPAAWSFVAGRAIEALRSGLVTARLNSADGLARIFEGAGPAWGETHRRSGRPAGGGLGPAPRAAADAGRRRQPRRAAGRCRVGAAALPDWDAFRRGIRHTCNRVGVLVSGSPVAALEVIAETETVADETPVRDTTARAELLRGPAARELIAFLLDPAFEAATSG